MSISGLEKFTDPLLIPLPPSPPPLNRHLPSRKPPGWVSVIPRLSSGRFRDTTDASSDTPPARVGELPRRWSGSREQLTSGDHMGESGQLGRYGSLSGQRPSPQEVQSSRQPHASSSVRRGSSRQVSGTMQYALRPSAGREHDAVTPIGIVGHSSSALGRRETIVQPSESPTFSSRHSSAGTSRTLDTLTDAELRTPLLPFYQTVDDMTMRIVSTDEVHRPGVADPSDDPSDDAGEGLERVEEARDWAIEGGPHHGTGSDHGHENDPIAEYNDSEQLERPEWLDEVLAERQADEHWMAYVRAQLGALFPDHFGESTETDENTGRGTGSGYTLEGRAEADIDDAVGVCSRSVATSLSGRLAGTSPPRAVEGTEGQLGLSQRVVSTTADKGSILGVNVRDEMRELREEMERLRGVVGGLSQMHAGTQGTVVAQQHCDPSSPGAAAVGAVHLRGGDKLVGTKSMEGADSVAMAGGWITSGSGAGGHEGGDQSLADALIASQDVISSILTTLDGLFITHRPPLDPSYPAAFRRILTPTDLATIDAELKRRAAVLQDVDEVEDCV